MLGADGGVPQHSTNRYRFWRIPLRNFTGDHPKQGDDSEGNSGQPQNRSEPVSRFQVAHPVIEPRTKGAVNENLGKQSWRRIDNADTYDQGTSDKDKDGEDSINIENIEEVEPI